jgi:hypothetical protein
MIIRLSQKLATKIKAGKLAEMPLDENQYADWSAHLFFTGRTQYIILCNTNSLYSCLMFGKGITNDGVFIERALSTIREFMEVDGQAFTYRRFIAPFSGTVSFAKALNRTVTGSMSDHIFGAKLLLEDDLSLHDVGFRLNETPMSALVDADGKKYGNPKDVFSNLVDRMGNE